MGTTHDQDKTRVGAPTVDIDYHSGAFVSSDIPERMAAWNEVRGGCPVAWNENGDGFWLLADYPSVHLASRDEATFLHAYDRHTVIVRAEQLSSARDNHVLTS